MPLTSGPLRAILRNLLFIVLLSNFRSASAQVVFQPYEVHIGYVIPTNRQAQPNAISDLQASFEAIQGWYADQMNRYGFGPKTFQFETLADGVTPKVYMTKTAITDAQMRQDIFNNTLGTAAFGVGPSNNPGSPKTVWALFSEEHVETSNGSVLGDTSLGSGGGGDTGGVTVQSSNLLPFENPSMLSNAASYGGVTIPAFGQFPMVIGNSFPSFDGSTFSQLASVAQGATTHELGHAFGLNHDFRNDNNFHGNLMGNGFRGLRASYFPFRFTTDDIQLSYVAAETLNVSRYFNRDKTFTDNVPPTVSVTTTAGAATPVNGQLQVAFHATDTAGLALAWLLRNGNVVGDAALSGTNQTFTFNTPYYTAGTTDTYSVVVYDSQGNRTQRDISLTPRAGFNGAPQPSIALFSSTVMRGQNAVFDASSTVDPNDSIFTLKFSWEMKNLDDGNLIDTPQLSSDVFATRTLEPGRWLVSATVTDPHGAVSVSEPLSLVVLPEPGAYLLLLSGVALLATWQRFGARNKLGRLSALLKRNRRGNARLPLL
jgi:hypothetical protein